MVDIEMTQEEIDYWINNWEDYEGDLLWDSTSS